MIAALDTWLHRGGPDNAPLRPAGGMPDVDGVTQIEMVGEFSKVVCVVVEIVPDRGLRRASMSATVVRDHPIPVPQEEQHLGVPVIGRQGASRG